MAKPKVKGEGKYTQRTGNLGKEETNTFEQIYNYHSLPMAITVSTLIPYIFFLNTAARRFFLKFKTDHVTPLLKTLQWRPITSRIKYKCFVCLFKIPFIIWSLRMSHSTLLFTNLL